MSSDGEQVRICKTTQMPLPSPALHKAILALWYETRKRHCDVALRARILSWTLDPPSLRKVEERSGSLCRDEAEIAP